MDSLSRKRKRSTSFDERVEQPSSRPRRDLFGDLSKVLAPELLKQRKGAGGIKLTYIDGFTAISLANKHFGPEGWEDTTVDKSFECETDKSGKHKAWAFVTKRVTVYFASGTRSHDGFGSGDGSHPSLKGDAVGNALKEAETDALKRALRCFGDGLGLCLYDKEYLRYVAPKMSTVVQQRYDAGLTIGKRNGRIVIGGGDGHEPLTPKSVDEMCAFKGEAQGGVGADVYIDDEEYGDFDPECIDF